MATRVRSISQSRPTTYKITNNVEGDSMKILLKTLEREVRHRVTLSTYTTQTDDGAIDAEFEAAVERTEPISEIWLC